MEPGGGGGETYLLWGVEDVKSIVESLAPSPLLAADMLLINLILQNYVVRTSYRLSSAAVAAGPR